MSAGPIFSNLVAYSLQIGMLVGLAAFVPTLLRLRQPGAKLVYWQILLAACLLLPLQPWKQVAIPGTVEVTTLVTAVQPLHYAVSRPSMPPGEIGLFLVLAGAAIRLGWLALGFWKLRRYRRTSRPLEPAPTWSAEASLRISGEISSPVTFGWRRPVVLLPANFPALDGRVQEAILCHEVLHVRRGDWAFTVMEELVRSALWFHPAIWWLLGEIGLAREQEVDRLAIEITREREPYMDALLAIAGARARLDLAPAPLFLRRRHLKHRVILILKEAKMSQARLISTLAAGLGILAMACWLVAGVFPLTAEPQVVIDAAGVTVNLNGATVMHRTAVSYPAAARQHGIQGTLQVEVTLDASGDVSDARVLSGPDELRKAVLQSVLQWHFTRDSAGAARVVQIAFELPPPGATEVVAAGAYNTASQSLAPPPRPLTAAEMPEIREMRQAQLAAPQSRRVHSIRIQGLSEPAAAALLAQLPIHEGDLFSPETLQRVAQAARAFDEHLAVGMSEVGPSAGQPVSTGFVDVDVVISAPGAQAATAFPPPSSPPAFTSSAPSERIKVAGNLQAVKIVHWAPPVYPQLARAARVSGTVQLAAIIGRDGTVQELHTLGGPALLIQAAMEAVKQWVYRPTLLNGEPMAVETTVDVNFVLDQ
jgi:TonB family protein